MMKSKAMSCFSLKSDQQGLEFVNPGEGSLTHEPALVHTRIEIALPSTLDLLSVALVLRNVGLDPAIPQYLPRSSCVEAAICVEDGTFVVQSTSLHVSEDVLELLHKLITIIMMTRDNSCGRSDVAIPVCYWQDIAGLGLLSPLIGDFFAPFFAALWLPSRLSSDKFSSPLIEITLASNSRWRLPSLLHLRK
jgi:hypothetical protein